MVIVYISSNQHVIALLSFMWMCIIKSIVSFIHRQQQCLLPVLSRLTSLERYSSKSLTVTTFKSSYILVILTFQISFQPPVSKRQGRCGQNIGKHMCGKQLDRDGLFCLIGEHFEL